jgi:hypothetical protein
MTVAELIDILKNCDEEAEVLLAHQPQWAFEYSIEEAAQTDPVSGLEAVLGRPWSDEDPDGCWWIFDPDDEDFEPRGPFVDMNGAQIAIEQMQAEHTPVVYIAEGHQIGYLPTEGRKAIGW